MGKLGVGHVTAVIQFHHGQNSRAVEAVLTALDVSQVVVQGVKSVFKVDAETKQNKEQNLKFEPGARAGNNIDHHLQYDHIPFLTIDRSSTTASGAGADITTNMIPHLNPANAVKSRFSSYEKRVHKMTFNDNLSYEWIVTDEKHSNVFHETAWLAVAPPAGDASTSARPGANGGAQTSLSTSSTTVLSANFLPQFRLMLEDIKENERLPLVPAFTQMICSVAQQTVKTAQKTDSREVKKVLRGFEGYSGHVADEKTQQSDVHKQGQKHLLEKIREKGFLGSFLSGHHQGQKQEDTTNYGEKNEQNHNEQNKNNSTSWYNEKYQILDGALQFLRYDEDESPVKIVLKGLISCAKVSYSCKSPSCMTDPASKVNQHYKLHFFS